MTATAASRQDSGLLAELADSATRAFVVAEICLMREGLSDALNRRGMPVVGAAPAGDDTLRRIRETRPDVIVFEVSRGPGAIRALRRAWPAAKVVAISVSEEDADIVRYAEAGIAGYVSADAGIDHLIAVIESALEGELLCPPSVAGTLLRRVAVLAAEQPSSPHGALTPRELEVAELLCAGLSNKEIASRLSICVSTAKNHVHSVLDKLGASRRGEAAARLAPALMLGD